MDKVETFLKRKKFENIQHLITNRHKCEILKIINEYENNKEKGRICNRLQNIYYFIIYDVDGDWLSRIEKILELGIDKNSDLALEVRYGKHGKEHISKSNQKMKNTLENFISRHGEELGNIKYLEYKEKNRFVWGLENAINKYGTEEGPKKWFKMLNKKTKTQSERKKVVKYRNGRTLNEYISRYGEIDGKIKWLERNETQRKRFSIEYYISRYGEIDGKIKWLEYCKNNNRSSLGSFIKRYGKKEGEIKYNEYIKIKKYHNTLEYYKIKYGEKEGEVKRLEYLEKIKFKDVKYSKISQELFWCIYDNIKNDLNENEIYFAEFNCEFVFNVKKLNLGLNVIMVDFKYGNKIIEFDGDYWHSSEKQKSIDKKRDEYLINNGFKVFRVKEKEYNKDKKIIINECVKFLKDE